MSKPQVYHDGGAINWTGDRLDGDKYYSIDCGNYRNVNCSECIT